MTPTDELAALERAITDAEQELAAARENLDAEVARLVLESDGDGLPSARAKVAELRDLLDARRSRAEVLRHRMRQEAA